jgi:hypothetical protein
LELAHKKRESDLHECPHDSKLKVVLEIKTSLEWSCLWAVSGVVVLWWSGGEKLERAAGGKVHTQCSAAVKGKEHAKPYGVAVVRGKSTRGDGLGWCAEHAGGQFPIPRLHDESSGGCMGFKGCPRSSRSFLASS